MTCYFYYGEETFLIQESISKLKTNFLENHSPSAIDEFKSGEEMETLLESLLGMDMFNPEKLIFYYGIPSVRDNYLSHFEKHLEKHDPGKSIVFVLKGKPDKRKKITKLLLSICESTEFKKFDIWKKVQKHLNKQI